MNLKNLKEIAADFAEIAGVPCHVVPLAVNISAPHLKLEYLGENINYRQGKDGAFEINIILRADGYNEAITDIIANVDIKLINAFDTNLKLKTSDYVITFNQSDIKTESLGWLYPDQLPGIAEPDPNEKNDNSTRMIYTRVFRLLGHYSKIGE